MYLELMHITQGHLQRYLRLRVVLNLSLSLTVLDSGEYGKSNVNGHENAESPVTRC